MNQRLNEDILNEISDFNIEEEIKIEDIERIEELFKNEVNIEPPKDLFQNIMETLDVQYEKEEMNLTKKDNNTVVSPISELLIYIKAQITLLDKSFWITSIIFILLGINFVMHDEVYLVNMISPFISLFSVYYIYRGFYNNVYEMELACKYSMYEITLGRSIIIICYNVLFSSVIAIANFTVNDKNLVLFIIISWLAPLLLTYYISLYFFFKKGISYSVTSNVFSWLIYIYLFYKIFDLDHSGLDSMDYSNSSWICINTVLIIISFILLAILLRNVKKIKIERS